MGAHDLAWLAFGAVGWVALALVLRFGLPGDATWRK